MSSSSVVINGRHAIVGNNIYTDLRSSHIERRDFDVLRHPPSPDDAPQPTSVILGDIWHVHWIRPAAPFMLLVPVNRQPFDDHLFSRLHHVHSIPLQQHENRSWSLRLDLMHEWHTLKLNLHAVWWAMLKKIGSWRPDGLRYWAWPHRYGYRLAYSSRRDAEIIAARSRNSFLPLMSSITFFIVLLDYLAIRYGSGYPEWRQDVITAANIHHQWFEDLEASVVGDLSVPRVGGIVDMSTCTFKYLLPLLRTLDMPLLLHWGPITDRPESLPEWLQPLAPDHVVIGQLRSIARTHSGRSYSPEPGTAPSSFPQVDRYSGQRPKEDMKAFFARREEQRLRRIEKETPQARRAREQRDADTRRNEPPGRHGARVYYWEDVNGFRIRKAAGRKHYVSYWEHSYKRRYDPFFNEWDICSEFSDSQSDHDSSSSDDDTDLDIDMDLDVDNAYPLLPEEDLSLSLNNQSQFSSLTDLERIHLVQESDGTAPESQDVFDTSHIADDVAYSRFGFIATSTDRTRNMMPWKTVAKVLGLSFNDNSTPSHRIRNAMEVFFGSHNAAKTYKSLPSQLYDLLDDELDVHRRKVDVRRVTLGIQEYFFLSPKSGDPAPFELALTSAASVVQILRCQWGPDLCDIARKLLARGIGFNTFIRGEFRPPTPERLVPRFAGLGYRPQGYEPDHIDYAAYVERRNRLLSSPRGRAALLHGGLIARFARGIVGFDDVCYGPSSNVAYDGRVLHDERNHGVGFWDDYWTKDEIDILCGVYRVDTGRKTRRGPQTSDLSLWPKPSAWVHCGLNIGFWSHDCEAWYLKREEKLKAGTAVLRTTADWKHTLKFTSQCLKTAENNEAFASEYLRRACH